jgi:hypothetical protein
MKKRIKEMFIQCLLCIISIRFSAILSSLLVLFSLALRISFGKNIETYPHWAINYYMLYIFVLLIILALILGTLILLPEKYQCKEKK